MPTQKKGKSSPTRKLKKVGKVTLVTAKLAGQGKECNKPQSSYSKMFVTPYGMSQTRTSCDPPTPEEEGAALNMAKDNFLSVAAAYCKAPKGSQCGESLSCEATVTFISIDNQGVVTTPVKDNATQVNCFIKFKVTGSITCTCLRAPKT
jgi:hypothetical protein